MITKEVKSATNSNRNSLIDSTVIDLGFKNFLSNNSNQLCLDAKGLTCLSENIEESLKNIEAAENDGTAVKSEIDCENDSTEVKQDLGSEEEKEISEPLNEAVPEDNKTESKPEENEVQEAEKPPNQIEDNVCVENQGSKIEEEKEDIVSIKETEITDETVRKQALFEKLSFDFGLNS
jgi:hypothetical protein